jgi:hypothetical protein
MVTENNMLWTFKESEKKPHLKAQVKTEKKFGIKDENYVLCRNCGNTITHPERIVSVNGQYQHTFTNPAGVIYDIVCFSSASGCTVYGDPTMEHTWFHGFSWCYSLCSSCLVHLGWYYQNEDETFFGLILERIVESARTH